MAQKVDVTEYRLCHLCSQKLEGQRYYTMTSDSVHGPYLPENPITLIQGMKPICESCVWGNDQPRELVKARLVADRGPALGFYRWLYQQGEGQLLGQLSDGIEPEQLTDAHEPPSPVRVADLLADAIRAAVRALEAANE